MFQDEAVMRKCVFLKVFLKLKMLSESSKVTRFELLLLTLAIYLSLEFSVISFYSHSTLFLVSTFIRQLTPLITLTFPIHVFYFSK